MSETGREKRQVVQRRSILEFCRINVFFKKRSLGFCVDHYNILVPQLCIFSLWCIRTSLNRLRQPPLQNVLLSSSSFSVSGLLRHTELQFSQMPMLFLQKSSKHAWLQNLMTASFRVSSHLVWSQWERSRGHKIMDYKKLCLVININKMPLNGIIKKYSS